MWTERIWLRFWSYRCWSSHLVSYMVLAGFIFIKMILADSDGWFAWDLAPRDLLRVAELPFCCLGCSEPFSYKPKRPLFEWTEQEKNPVGIRGEQHKKSFSEVGATVLDLAVAWSKWWTDGFRQVIVDRWRDLPGCLVISAFKTRNAAFSSVSVTS